MNTPVLSAPNFDKQFKLTVDASDIGIGEALLQESDDGVDRVVSYFLKKLTKSQKNYSTIENECLALLLALQHFDVYLNVTLYPILVYTDHNPLTFLCKNNNQRLTRWSLLLQEYDIIIHHIKGKDIVIADALSRVSWLIVLLLSKFSLTFKLFKLGRCCEPCIYFCFVLLYV